MRLPLHRLRAVAACCLTALGVGLAVASFQGSEPTSAGGHDHHAAAPETRPPVDMDRIVAATRCPRPQEQGRAADYRQVVCQSPQGRYTIMTFATAAGKDAWLEAAQPYGGTYLVGDRWAVVATPALLGDLRAELGGELREHGHHGP
ncbi:hypothetical protein [Nonomuraea aridisoli]|uniref:hypothetical protein n=1 Tax=Nonomuraea aridisoli TaxID=2070368 RepID=UPI0011B93E54|nr:hypothetical protein [Nonomuraea aridisoli]